MSLPIYQQEIIYQIPRRFIVQKHQATNLHYDLRLEYAGVLKSWALRLGPCLDPDQQRLAVLVKDHDLRCGEFEGTIPAGRYGAGTIMLWDEGTWTTAQDVGQALAIGQLNFQLSGQKLKGGWSMTRGQVLSNGREEWNLQKEPDHEARAFPDILEEKPKSVRSGLTLEEWAKKDSTQFRRSARANTRETNSLQLTLPFGDFER